MNPLEQGSRTFSTVVPRLKKELFLIVVVLLYVIALALDPARAVRAATLGGKVFLTVIPVMAAAFGALGLFQVLIKKERIARSLGSQSGFRGLLAASAFGSVLVGPVYIIFPLLRMMREHGARWAIITAVLTSWAVKLPMIPLEIQFLGWRFAALRSALVIVASVCLGLLVELLMPKGHRKTDLDPEVDGRGEGAEAQPEPSRP